MKVSAPKTLAHWFWIVLFFLGTPTVFGQRPHCGLRLKRAMVPNKVPSDCGSGRAVIRPEYNPHEVLIIRTVVHVIHQADGVGKLSQDAVRRQIDVLNRDFRALNRAQTGFGTDAAIQFQLAARDPEGNPTDGVIYTENDTWFAGELGDYGPSLVWDPTRYMNVYFTQGEGFGGVVYQLPWEPNPTPGFEGLVVAYDVIEDDESVISHEVGHYLGLEHTFGFDEVCPSGDCYTTGDLLCDTGTHLLAEDPTCDPRESCGEPEPVNNIMNYTSCLLEFTPEQINRMRCSLFNYRSGILTADDLPGALPSRWIPHITSPGSDFKTGIYLTNPHDESLEIVLKAFGKSGELLDEMSLPINGLSREYKEISEIFAASEPSHLGLSGSSQIIVSAAYRIDHLPSVSAHLAEFGNSGRTFLLHLGEKDVVFDGLAMVNVGSGAARVTAKPWSEQEGQGKAVVLAESIPVRGKALANMELFLDDSASAMVLIEADQPLVVLGLRGSKPGSDLPFLFANPIIEVP